MSSTASQQDGKSIVLLDPLTGKEISRAHGSDRPAQIVFSADGSLLTCRRQDGMVRNWDTASGKARKRFQALSTSIDRIAFFADGKRLALTGRADQAVRIWDVPAGANCILSLAIALACEPLLSSTTARISLQ